MTAQVLFSMFFVKRTRTLMPLSIQIHLADLFQVQNLLVSVLNFYAQTYTVIYICFSFPQSVSYVMWPPAIKFIALYLHLSISHGFLFANQQLPVSCNCISIGVLNVIALKFKKDSAIRLSTWNQCYNLIAVY